MKQTRNITIETGGVTLDGILTIPDNVCCVVVFAHGSGSSRLSPRNTSVAEQLQSAGIATLLMDLLTVKEDEEYNNRFNIELLTERLRAAIQWARQETDIINLPVGLFGASTGAASAFFAAHQYGELICAVVSRGGRPDLALQILDSVVSPSLLIVGGSDEEVLQLNKLAFDQMKCEKKLHIIPGATHLFEESGALEEVAHVAANWFTTHCKLIPKSRQ